MALTHDDWPRLKEVFAGARALPPDRRPAYLAEACGDDEALRQEVESLLASSERAGSFLERPAAAQLQDAFAAANLEGRRIGSYQIEAWIGAGAMGEVYRALDTKLNRQVAIKVLLPAVADDPGRLARFSREAQVLASLNHPHIAQIHGLEDTGGVRALGMEMVGGPTLADRIASGKRHRVSDLASMGPGAFGENLTMRGITEEDACIGDVFQAGELVLQIWHSRQPCWKLARKWRVRDLADRVIDAGRTGWYCRVLAEGWVSTGTEMVVSWRRTLANR